MQIKRTFLAVFCLCSARADICLYNYSNNIITFGKKKKKKKHKNTEDI